MVHAQQNNMLSVYKAKKEAIDQNISADPTDADLLTELAKVNNNIIQLEFKMNQEVDMYLSKKEKSEYRLNGKTHADQVSKLKIYCAQVFDPAPAG